MISVFYDGKCGLCSREINYYKKLEPKRSIAWRDIAHEPAFLEGTGLSQADALLYLRVQDEHGVIHSGLDAFIIIWKQFSGWSFLARLVEFPVFRSGAGFLYRRFAHYRFRRHAHCQASLTAA